MIIANQLRHSNVSEYLLYMWQIEDILRAYQCNFDELKSHYLTRFTLAPETQAKNETWYADLCKMLIEEGKKEKGHLQINQNLLHDLIDLHNQLLNSPNFPYYKTMYYKVLPYIVELRNKDHSHQNEHEIETCFDILYGTLLLKLQHKPISEETKKAVKDISVFLGQLSDYYIKNEQTALEF